MLQPPQPPLHLTSPPLRLLVLLHTLRQVLRLLPRRRSSSAHHPPPAATTTLLLDLDILPPLLLTHPRIPSNLRAPTSLLPTAPLRPCDVLASPGTTSS